MNIAIEADLYFTLILEKVNVQTARLPLLHLTSGGLHHAHNLVAVEQTLWVKSVFHLFVALIVSTRALNGREKCRIRSTYLSHQINSRLPNFVRQVIALHQSNAVLSCRCAFHLDRTLDHAVHQRVRNTVLSFVVQDDGVEVSVTDVTHDATDQATTRDVTLRLIDDLCQTAHGHGHIGRPHVIITALLLRHDGPEGFLAGLPKFVGFLVGAREFE
jgi:hypothetical protein